MISDRFKVATFNVSENCRMTSSLLKSSRANSTNCGPIVSAMKRAGGLAASRGISTTGNPTMSQTRSRVKEMKQFSELVQNGSLFNSFSSDKLNEMFAM